MKTETDPLISANLPHESLPLTPQDSLHLENLDLRAHVWGIEQDLQKVAKEGEC